MALAALSAGCSRYYESSLPESSALGNPRGMRVARVITHYHSPYSWDACDKAGLANGVPDQRCLADFKKALCQNHIDYAFVTDHTSSFADYEFSDLLLKQGNDTLVGSPVYANQVSSCTNGFTPVIMTGLESKLLTLGQTAHNDTNIATRKTLYDTDPATASMVTSLKATGAVVMVPHTESYDLSLLTSLGVDGIEIYNIHANLDPKYRKHYLGLAPFDHIPKVLTYLLDPYGDLNPDYSFVQFLSVSSVYATKWNQMIAAGQTPAGWGGTDSHENVFPQTGSDGERLDSHRRLTRFMSNHVLVSSLSAANIKDSLRYGRGWMVFEGFGTPVGMDFYATATNGTVISVGAPGGSLSSGGGSARITVKAPSLYANRNYGGDAPVIRIELREVAGGTDTKVAESTGSDLTYTVSSSGTYRAQVYITPKHLKPVLGPFASQAEQEFPWITTNHVFLTP